MRGRRNRPELHGQETRRYSRIAVDRFDRASSGRVGRQNRRVPTHPGQRSVREAASCACGKRRGLLDHLAPDRHAVLLATRSTVGVWRRQIVTCSSSSAITYDGRAGFRPLSGVRLRPPRSGRTGSAASNQPGQVAVAPHSGGGRAHVLRAHVSRSRGNRPRTAHASLGLKTAQAASATRL
jgi:hypothetical protein